MGKDDSLDDLDAAVEGPLYRETLRRANAVDKSGTTAERRQAVPGLVLIGIVALAERALRSTLEWGAVLFSLLAIGLGVSSGDLAWAIPMVVSGLAGIALVVVALARRWSFASQWVVLLGVTVVQIVLIVVQWRTTN
jgi:hypothetical protein